MDFAMRYDRWCRPLSTVFGMGPKRAVIRVDDNMLRVKHGWAFQIDVPLGNIASARLYGKRPLAWGVHGAEDGWLVNGSRDGVVIVRFATPVKPVKAPLGAWPVRCVLVSLEKPDAFLAALRGGKENV
ncbi:hypothetical protein [Segniliparus rotundus]|nr:hypothetical protein [Segniliparus rotundus]